MLCKQMHTVWDNISKILLYKELKMSWILYKSHVIYKPHIILRTVLVMKNQEFKC